MITSQSFYQKLKYTLFQWFRWVSLVLRVCLVWSVCDVKYNSKSQWKFIVGLFVQKQKQIDSEHIELNHYQDNFRSPSFIIKVNHCQSSIPQPLIGLNRSQLAVRERRPTANCATRNFQLFSSRGQPIPCKHHSNTITGVKTKVWLAFSEPSTWPGFNTITFSHRENQQFQREKDEGFFKIISLYITSQAFSKDRTSSFISIFDHVFHPEVWMNPA